MRYINVRYGLLCEEDDVEYDLRQLLLPSSRNSQGIKKWHGAKSHRASSNMSNNSHVPQRPPPGSFSSLCDTVTYEGRRCIAVSEASLGARHGLDVSLGTADAVRLVYGDDQLHRYQRLMAFRCYQFGLFAI